MVATGAPRIFSAARRRARSARAAARVGQAGSSCWLLQHLESEIIERIDFMRHEPDQALLIGLNTQELTSELDRMGAKVNSLALRDDETPIETGPFDLIVSMAMLDTVNDLPGALIHLRNALAAGGVMFAPILGAGSLSSLRQILMTADGDRPAARVHPQIDTRAATALMERAGFARQVVDTHTLSVRYGSLETLFGDLRAQALTNVLADAPPPLTRASLERARAAFSEMADDEGRVTETFEILTLTGWG